jgi:putative CocE/NonD family hydrolase
MSRLSLDTVSETNGVEGSLSAYAGSSVSYDCVIQHDVAVPMRDGIVLKTDIFLPARNGEPLSGRWPVVIERTPYDRRRVSHSVTGRHFARRGYVGIMQDCRGRWGSEGEFYFLRNEADDGFDTLAWISRQSWCDGRIGTLGLSYTTALQQAMAVRKPKGLVTQLLFDGGYNYHSQTMRHAGACEYGIFLQYVLWMARLSQEASADPAIKSALDGMWRDLNKWVRRLPLRQGASPLALVPRYERWFFDMLTHADYDEYWKDVGYNLEEFVDQYPDIPVFLQTSWYGHHITATLDKYAEFKSRHQTPKKLLVGTWIHGPENFGQSFAGDIDFGPEAALESLNDLRSRWCDHYIKGLKTGIDEEAPVRIFVMGGGTGRRNALGRMEHGGIWRDESQWPPADMRLVPYYLGANGELSPQKAPGDAAPSTFTFNPNDPVPTIGGNFLNLGTAGFLEGGGWDQRGRTELALCTDTFPLSARRDVLTFRTAPLDDAVEVTGPLVVKLWIASSAIDTDFTAKLIDEYPPNDDYPNGYALNIADSIARCRYRNSREKAEMMVPGNIYEIEIEPQATSNLFAKGHCIRLDISSSNFPHYDVNTNTGEPLGLERRFTVANQTVFHDGARPSHIVLPIMARRS